MADLLGLFVQGLNIENGDSRTQIQPGSKCFVYLLSVFHSPYCSLLDCVGACVYFQHS